MNMRMRELLGDVLELAEPVDDGGTDEFVIPGDLYREIHALLAELAAEKIDAVGTASYE